MGYLHTNGRLLSDRATTDIGSRFEQGDLPYDDQSFQSPGKTAPAIARSEDGMTTKSTEQAEPTEDRNAFLEKQLIEQYLHEKGYSLEGLKKLPADLAEKLMKEASQYASLKMEEVEARANFVHDLQNDGSSFK